MDILAARKKAAEQANARNKPEPHAAAPAAQPEPEAAAPAVQPKQEPEATPAPAESCLAVPAASPAAAGVAPLIEESRDKAGAVPVSSAREPEKTQQGEIELLSFRLGGEEYAVLVADVREVLKFFHLTIVPNTPDYVLGVMSLRGTMLPIIDLCKRFGLAAAVKNEKSRVVVASSADEEAGLLVDQVTGVFRIFPDEIKPIPENIEQGAEFLSGIVRTADRLYILLDLGKALGV
ncbi:MAG: chemotaxis protein CheW [Nitrospirae bacterium]|nr:chemotaxis protein CheW [Nitrospirota bacterium]